MNFQLRALRKKKGLRQEDLASEAKTTPRVVGAWERGETSISLEDAAVVADILGCSLDELAGRDWSPSTYADEQQARLNANYESVTDPGKQRIAEHSDDIATNPAYRLAAGRVQDNPLPTQEVA